MQENIEDDGQAAVSEKDSKKPMSKKKKAVGFGALLAVLIPLLITIIGEVDGSAVGKRLNSWLSSPAIESVQAQEPQQPISIDAKQITTPTDSKKADSVGGWLDGISTRLEGLEQIVQKITSNSTIDIDALNQLRGETTALRELFDAFEEKFIAFVEKYNKDRIRVDTFMQESFKKDMGVLEEVRGLRQRLAFIEGKIDIALRRNKEEQ